MPPIVNPLVKSASGKVVSVNLCLPDKSKKGEILSFDDKMKMRDNLENTKAGNWALELSDQNGNIKGEDFNNFVRTHFPGVKFNPVKDTIDVFTAMDSFTTYDLQLQTIQKAKQRSQLEASGEKPSTEI